MLLDDLREKLKDITPDIRTIETFWQSSGKEELYQELYTTSIQETFWQNPDQASILKRLQKIKTQREQYLFLIKNQNDLLELIELFSNDEQELAKLRDDVHAQWKSTQRFKIELLLSDEKDDSNCFLNVNAGAGGTEAQDWAEMVLRMYIRFCEREKFSTTILDYQAGEGAGIKSATIFIKGKNSYGLLKGEHGIHRLVRISPYDASKRRHTSFAGVSVIPEIEDVSIAIDPKDLRIDTYRAGGAGGQHVNKTDSAVRITHIPTNIVVQCQNERSQGQNKETAMKMLASKLAEKQREEREAELAKIERKQIEWGSQLRSYILHPYKMVKDHRTDIESPQPEAVLDGDLMNFIEKYLIYSQSKS